MREAWGTVPASLRTPSKWKTYFSISSNRSFTFFYRRIFSSNRSKDRSSFASLRKDQIRSSGNVLSWKRNFRVPGNEESTVLGVVHANSNNLVTVAGLVTNVNPFFFGRTCIDMYHLVAGCRRIAIERNDILVPSKLRRPFSLSESLVSLHSSLLRCPFLPYDLSLPTLVAVSRRWPLTDLRSWTVPREDRSCAFLSILSFYLSSPLVSLSLSLSLSLTHTHTHTHTLSLSLFLSLLHPLRYVTLCYVMLYITLNVLFVNASERGFFLAALFEI